MQATITVGQFWRSWLYACVWLVLLAAGITRLALADDRAEHSLEFVDQDVLALELAANAQTVSTTVTIRNNGPSVEEVQFFATLQDGNGAVTNIGPLTPQPPTAQSFRVTIFTLNLPTTTKQPLSGHLTINGVNSTVLPGVRKLSISPAFVPPPYVTNVKPKDVLIWVVALGIASLLVVGAKFWPPGLKLGKVMKGPPNWDTKGSWATNLTAVGAVLNLVSAENILPETTKYLTSAQYSALALLFSALALIAPAIFIFINRRDPSQAAAAEPVAQSWVWVFLLASIMTLWAVYGQLLLALLILDELRVANTLSTATFTIFALVVMGAGLLLMWYAPRKIRETASYTPPESEQAQMNLIVAQALRQPGVVDAIDRAGREAVVVTSPPRAARSWSLL